MHGWLRFDGTAQPVGRKFWPSFKESPMAANPIPPSQLNLGTVKTPDETIVHCSGRITSSTSEQLQTAVRSLIPSAKCVVLDLTNVSYMDSSGLGALVGLYVSAKNQ